MNNAQRKRMKEASDSLSNAIAIIEEVRDEEQEKLDNMPESLQMSSRYDEMEAGIDSLEDIISSLEDAEAALSEFAPVQKKK